MTARNGGVAEWSIASVLKTDGPQGPASSNLAPSAIVHAAGVEVADSRLAGTLLVQKIAANPLRES